MNKFKFPYGYLPYRTTEPCKIFEREKVGIRTTEEEDE